MSDLVTWLRAQLDADEQTARDALHNRIVLTVAKHAGKTGAHAFWFRHDPARVLRQVAAMRAIVDWCSERDRIYVGTHLSDADAPRPSDFVEGRLKHPQDAVVLRHLATIYADRDGYRPEWAPE